VTRLISLLVTGCLLALVAPVSAVAQDAATEGPKIRLGPLGLSPRISLTNIGIDTNVLSQSENPQRDFTTTFVPGVDSSLRIGRGLLTGKTGVELVYFTKTTAQRSIGVDQEGRFDLNLNRLTPHLGAGYLTTYRRPNSEIDVRVGQTTKSADIGASLRLGWRAALEIGASHSRLELSDVEFLGVSLAKALDRRVETASLNVSLVLTPLTTFVVKNTVEHDRFTLSPDRDTDSVSIVPGLELKPSALVSGSAFVGFRSFGARNSGERVFAGVVAAVALSYAVRDSTRLDVKIDRNMDYSFEPTQPYFLATGGNLSVTQALGGHWDTVTRLGRQYLVYRNSTLDSLGSSGRRDRVVTYGFGPGYRLTDARIGFDVNYVRRLSPVDSRRFSGFQFGGSFRYGF
jgi:hypothetical protein